MGAGTGKMNGRVSSEAKREEQRAYAGQGEARGDRMQQGLKESEPL